MFIIFQVPPTRQSYNNLLSAYGSTGDWKQVLKICKKMMDNGVGPDIVTHNIIMSALKNGGEHEKAISYFNDMEARNFPMDRYTYNILIKCLLDKCYTLKIAYIGKNNIKM